MFKKLLIISAILLISLSSPVFSVGISPGRITTMFEENEQLTYQFTVLNTLNVESAFSIYVRGALEDYISLSESRVTIGPRGTKTLSFTANFPSELAPGRHDTRIGALEVPDEATHGKTAVGAVPAVELQFWVYSRYAGKYLEVTSRAPDVALGEKISFTISLTSRGTQDITNAYAEVKIFSIDGELVQTLTSDSVSVKVDSSEQLYVEWEPGELPPGRYTAEITVFYNGETTKTTTSFVVGEHFIEILEVSTKDIPMGSIGRTNVKLQSFWNEAIDGAHISIDVLSNNQKIKTFTSPVFNIPAQSTTTQEVFIDTDGFEIKEYDMLVKLHYSGKVTETSSRFKVVPRRTFSAAIVFSITIIVVLIFISAIFLYKHRDSSSTKDSNTSKETSSTYEE